MSTLKEAIADYLAVRRALGFKLRRAELLLADFARYMEIAGAHTVTTELAVAWATKVSGGANWKAARLGVVRGFAGYRKALDPCTEVPPADLLPRQGRRATPFIYSEADIVRLMQAANSLHSRIRRCTYFTLIGLLAVTGMRVGEAIRLDHRDIDWNDMTLTIRKTKFDKSRLIVLHPTTVAALHAYDCLRNELIPHPPDPSFFVSQAGTRLLYCNVQWTFVRLVRLANVAPRSARCRPRLHDLRHTFAVRTALGWYRDGVDAAARLPLLSTYLGHTTPRDTYWYLSATPELLSVAANRLERQLGDLP